MTVLNLMLTGNCMTKYLVDTNVLISAYRIKYPMDVIPTFWEIILKELENGTICMIDQVAEEILVGGDQLSEWLKDNFKNITLLESDTYDVIGSYSEILQTVMDNPQYSDIAKYDYADVADSWLIAHAKANRYTIVTEEVFNRDIKKKVPIPNICREQNVEYINTIEFLRRIKAKI